MQLFYNSAIDETCEGFAFDREESKHIVKVLRKKEGDILFVTNGLGFLFQTEITLASDNKCLVRIVSSEKHRPFNYKLHLAVAPTKMNERYEWFVEKATELGVSEITPIICDHSERKVIKTDRLEKIILAAMKQSNQYYLPKLNEAVSFKDFVKAKGEGLRLIAHCEPTEKRSLKSMVKPGADLTILIGPEGDFSEKEIQISFDNSYIPVSLGETRLRTETAAIAACHSVAFVNEI